MIDISPTVGRIVHFYDPSLSGDANGGLGIGPYAAMITQVPLNGNAVGLKVHPVGTPWDESAVPHKDDATDDSAKYWRWPEGMRLQQKEATK